MYIYELPVFIIRVLKYLSLETSQQIRLHLYHCYCFSTNVLSYIAYTAENDLEQLNQ